MRWSSTADNQGGGQPRRERFSSAWSVLGITAAFLLLLALLYPEERLLDLLGRSHDGDAATIRYLEALLRVRPGDGHLRVQLAEALLLSGAPDRALAVTDDGLSPDDQRRMLEVRYRALKVLLADTRTNGDARRRYLAAFGAAARRLADDHATGGQLREYAADAKTVGDQETWRLLAGRAGIPILEPVTSPAAGTADPYAVALARGDYRTAAALCFAAMERAAGLDRKREFLIKGVRTLQSGNMPVEAFEAGERHLDGLAHDRAALVFLTRAGLAAGKPEQAQRLIRRALNMPEKPAIPDLS